MGVGGIEENDGIYIGIRAHAPCGNTADTDDGFHGRFHLNHLLDKLLKLRSFLLSRWSHFNCRFTIYDLRLTGKNRQSSI
jgi:hypothetical protein